MTTVVETCQREGCCNGTYRANVPHSRAQGVLTYLEGQRRSPVAGAADLLDMPGAAALVVVRCSRRRRHLLAVVLSTYAGPLFVATLGGQFGRDEREDLEALGMRPPAYSSLFSPPILLDEPDDLPRVATRRPKRFYLWPSWRPIHEVDVGAVSCSCSMSHRVTLDLMRQSAAAYRGKPVVVWLQ